jgi:DNA polymerase III subunit beta
LQQAGLWAMFSRTSSGFGLSAQEAGPVRKEDMKVVLARAPLLDDLRLAERLLPLRSPDLLLTHVLLQAGDSVCTLLVHDREIALWLRLQGQVEQPGSALLPLRQLLAFVRECGAETLRLERDDDRVLLRGPGVTCDFNSVDPSRFPTPGPLPSRAHALMEAGRLHRAIRQTLFAAARGPGHYRDYLLEAVLLEIGPAGLRLVSSDNRRMSVAEVPLRPGGGSVSLRRLLLSVRALALLGRLAQEQEECVRAFFGAGHAFFRVGRATLAARLLQGRFPDWEAALPASTRRVVELPVEALLAAVRQAAVLREDFQARLVLHLEPGRLTLGSQKVGTGSVTVEREVDYAGEPVAVAFNPIFLLEMLRAMEAEGTVRMEMDAEDRAVLFVGPGNYRHLLMPLRPATPVPEPVFTAGPPLSMPAASS